MMDHRLIADITESVRRYLATEIAVDARGVDEELSRNVLRVFEICLRQYP